MPLSSNVCITVAESTWRAQQPWSAVICIGKRDKVPQGCPSITWAEVPRGCHWESGTSCSTEKTKSSTTNILPGYWKAPSYRSGQQQAHSPRLLLTPYQWPHHGQQQERTEGAQMTISEPFYSCSSWCCILINECSKCYFAENLAHWHSYASKKLKPNVSPNCTSVRTRKSILP